MKKYYDEEVKNFKKALARAVPIKKGLKQLLPHELELFNDGKLSNITHKGSTSVWLEAPSHLPPEGMTSVYRPMGDIEAVYLWENKELPETQPYQAIIEGSIGRNYADKYLTGKKYTDTMPSTIVEFIVPVDVIETLQSMQMKVEDGALSMGLGDKAGKGLPIFNAALREGRSSFRIVKVKRMLK